MVDERLTLGLTGASPFLVDGASGDLLGRVLALAPLLDPNLMWRYWRSRFLLQAACGIVVSFRSDAEIVFPAGRA